MFLDVVSPHPPPPPNPTPPFFRPLPLPPPTQLWLIISCPPFEPPPYTIRWGRVRPLTETIVDFITKNSKKFLFQNLFATKSCVFIIFSMHKSYLTVFGPFQVWRKGFDKFVKIMPTKGTRDCLARSPSSFRTHVARSLSLSLRAVKHESVFYYNICVKESVFSNEFWNKLCSLKVFIYANRLIWIK